MAGATPWPDNLTDYIGGHLSNYTVGESGEGAVTWALHLDTLVMSWAMALLALWLLRRGAGNPSAHSPSKPQVFCEMMFGFFDKQVRELFPDAPPIVAPLALTIFVWVFLMNCMDLVPVDLVAAGGYMATGSVPHFKLLPTADLSLTAAVALVVFAMTLYYNVKTKGAGGFAHEIAAAPFGIVAAPVNILLRIVEEVARPLSLAMRLFGNLFAAEVIFLLIGGGMSFIFASLFGDAMAFAGQWIFGGPWAIYHILVVPLQAYIFAVLTVVYLAMAHQKH
ncbi:MAG: F0F1 ATP synthase subunit A [Gammaproteobacteria bacterium]